MKEKGQSLVEFAVGFVLLLIVLAGMVELGTAIFQQIQLLDAAQEGVIFGSTCQDANLIKQRIIGASSSPVDLSKTEIGISIVPSVVEGAEITISITHHHKVFAPFASVFFGKEIPITGRASGTILRTDGCQ